MTTREGKAATRQIPEDLRDLMANATREQILRLLADIHRKPEGETLH